MEDAVKQAGRPAIELRHLRYFVAVAETLNFSRAALALDTAQPSLSQQIRHLEDEVGVELFDRGKRQIALTPAGVEFLADARALLAQVETAVAHAREAGRGRRGELRIAYTVSAMMANLPAAIRAYRADHPDVRITLRALPPVALVEALREREADAGVLIAQRGSTRFDGLDVRRVGSLPLAAIVPEGHRLAGRRAVAVEDLGTETLILVARRLAGVYDAVLALCRERGFVPARIEEVDRYETILGLVAAGEGLSISPRVYERLGFRGLRYAALSPAPEPFTIFVASTTESRSPLTAAFVATYARLASAAARA